MDPVHTLLGIKSTHLVAGIAGGVVRAFLAGGSCMEAVSAVIVGSLTAGTPAVWADTGLCAGKIARRIADAGAALGIGCYDEVRGVYASEAFAKPGMRFLQNSITHCACSRCSMS